jgi:diaminopimelate decarboxylase
MTARRAPRAWGEIVELESVTKPATIPPDMDFFTYKQNELHCENVPAERIASEVGTPVYVYSKATLLHHYRQLVDAFAPVKATICYSIKSCGNLNICRLLAEQGCGFDVTSAGELYRALEAGGDPKKIIYAGVGKSDDEIAMAINAGIAAFNLESEAEIENVDRVANVLGKTATGALRVNPDVDNRQEGDEVWRRYRAGRARVRSIPKPQAPAHRRRAHAHRIAGVRDPTLH